MAPALDAEEVLAERVRRSARWATSYRRKVESLRDWMGRPSASEGLRCS
jgi:hypothetical protein